MIPKKIHYCWFGHGKKNKLFKKCLASWKKHCPDYEIIEWNESNYDVHKNKYMLEAYKNKKWGFVPDYARYDIIYKEGGIYLDTDVELVKPIDDLLDLECYMGFEGGKFINGGIGFGAIKGNGIVKKLRDMYDNIDFYNEDGSLNLTPSPYYITSKLKEIGLKDNDTFQNIKGVTVFPTEYFAPKDYNSKVLNITAKTYSIHHYDGSWIPFYMKLIKKIKRKIKRL